MSSPSPYDLVIKNACLVRPREVSTPLRDVAVRDGKVVAVGVDLPVDGVSSVVDADGLLLFPGLVDAHMHVGIYQPLADDALSESRAAAMGGVTSSLNYMRTGQYYLNRGGPYADFFPEVLKLSDGRFYVDYAYHLAPMNGQHIDELPYLVGDFGVTSFKSFMFYGNYGLHGRSSSQH